MKTWSPTNGIANNLKAGRYINHKLGTQERYAVREVLRMNGPKTTRRISEGKCGLCNTTFSKAAMTRHLKLCRQGKAVETPSKGRRSQERKILHLAVEGRHLPEYWMHLEALASATLEDMDTFLRRTWLECCSHLSAFTIEGKQYVSDPSEEFGDKGMDVTLGKVLSVGTRFYHEYDFGTTTELALKVVSERMGRIGRESIQLLARNNPPLVKCRSCKKAATKVCSQCDYSDKRWLCDECAKKHKCGEEMLLPVVNSPRTGMCAYTG
jgi:hypothetical protein